MCGSDQVSGRADLDPMGDQVVADSRDSHGRWLDQKHAWLGRFYDQACVARRPLRCIGASAPATLCAWLGSLFPLERRSIGNHGGHRLDPSTRIAFTTCKNG